MAGKKEAKKTSKKAVKELDLAQQLATLFDTDDKEEKKPVVLMLSGEIGDEHQGIINELMTLHYKPDFNDVVTILINSEGGDVNMGWAIVDVMNFVKFPIETVVIGLAASAAADIFINGDRRVMGSNATLMIHDASFIGSGNYHDLVATRKYHDMEYQRGIRHYIMNSKYKTEAEVKAKILNGRDNYFTPQEAIEHGLADHATVPGSNKREKIHHYLSSKK